MVITSLLLVVGGGSMRCQGSVRCWTGASLALSKGVPQKVGGATVRVGLRRAGSAGRPAESNGEDDLVELGLHVTGPGTVGDSAAALS